MTTNRLIVLFFSTNCNNYVSFIMFKQTFLLTIFLVHVYLHLYECKPLVSNTLEVLPMDIPDSAAVCLLNNFLDDFICQFLFVRRVCGVKCRTMTRILQAIDDTVEVNFSFIYLRFLIESSAQIVFSTQVKYKIVRRNGCAGDKIS